MDKINDSLVEDALALEVLFRNAGLEAHARAIRIALEDAQEDIIKEQNYGTDTIYNGLKSSIEINKSVTAGLSDNLTNNDVINILDQHIGDIDNIKDVYYAPKFVQSNNIPILKTLSSLIEHLKPQEPDDDIDEETFELLKKLQKNTGNS